MPEIIYDDSGNAVTQIVEVHGKLLRVPPPQDSLEDSVEDLLADLDDVRKQKFLQARKTAAEILLSSGMSYSEATPTIGVIKF